VRPSDWSRQNFVRVAIHVRRGDVLNKAFSEHGFSVPNSSYFLRAMDYFTSKYERVQFIAVSSDTNWMKKHIVYRQTENKTALFQIINNSSSIRQVNVAYAVNHTAGQDMAIMTSCDHVIMSTGTFGWWAAWLANGTTIYYRKWPKNGSKLFKLFSRVDFYPPEWIPMYR